MSARQSGGCLCGEVRFEVNAPKPEFNICHCGRCRKWSAGPFMSVHCENPDVKFESETALGWYQGTPWAQRGFCKACGTSLFWRLAEQPDAMLIVSVDAFDNSDAYTLGRHIYTDAQPNRYQFADDTPRVTEAEVLVEVGVNPEDMPQ